MMLGQIEDREAFWERLFHPGGELWSRLPILRDRSRQTLLRVPAIHRTEVASDVSCDDLLVACIDDQIRRLAELDEPL